MKSSRIIPLGLALMLVMSGIGWAQSEKPEKPKLVLAVGGGQGLIYLPFALTWRLGYFKEAGLDVDIENLAGGGQALRALIGGSADVVSGFYDHTIQMQAQGKSIKAFVMQQRYPGLVLLVSKSAREKGVQTLADLKGKKIGVTALGSSSHFFVNFLLAGAGLSVEDFSTLGVGLGSTAIAAIRNNQIEALSALEPTVTTLQTGGDIGVILADTRTTNGTIKVFGGPYPSASMYTKEEFIRQYPNTVKALATAMIRSLRWIQTHKAEEIAAAMPEEYYQGSKELYIQSVRNMIDSYSQDGMISPADAKNALKVLSFDPAVKGKNLNLNDTYDMRFVEAYWKSQKK
jgi:NitT/TauT family transport system substrate-binding protein